MSLKEKKIPQNVGESEEENEIGACGGNDPPMSLSAAEAILGGYLDESVDNLSMEVHLGDDNSRHPSEISSISYQNLLEDSEPSNSIRSRRGSDDSVESYPPDFPDAELPPDDMETFEASDLPLSEHFPMGSLQGNDSYKMRSLCSSDIVPSSRTNVKLKDSDPIKIREKNKVGHSNSVGKSEEMSSKKRNSLEIRNNIPTVGEVKDYDKQLNLDVNKVQNAKPKMIGLKQSPGLARRVDVDNSDLSSSKFSEGLKKEQDEEAQDSSLSSLKAGGQKSKSKNSVSRTSEGVIEVITPIPKNMNIENEYDYVKYARVQQGNSYVGMRLAYSSSNDSLNLKHAGGSVNSSRETSPEKVLQQKIISELGQNRVNEENLTEIPLNNSDYSEDKKAFTLSPENTECDSVEVESVTSEGENSPAGFPTVEDGLSSSQASDAEEGGAGLASDRSPSKVLQNKQKASIDQQLDSEEFHGPQEMDAQAIMEDLKMKREALDMAIADIKSAIQRSKNMSLETSYNSEHDAEEVQPVWIKRDSSNQAAKRPEELSKGKENIDGQQDSHGSTAGKSTQERDEKEPNNNDIESEKGSLKEDDENKKQSNNNDCLIIEEEECIQEEKQTFLSCSAAVVSISEVINSSDEVDVDNEQAAAALRNSSPSNCEGQSTTHSPDLSLMNDSKVKKELDPVVLCKQTNQHLVNDAIASVSNQIIQNLGNSLAKNKEAFPESVPSKTEEILKPKTADKNETQDCDVSEFDVLSGEPSIPEIPQSIEEDPLSVAQAGICHHPVEQETFPVESQESDVTQPSPDSEFGDSHRNDDDDDDDDEEGVAQENDDDVNDNDDGKENDDNEEEEERIEDNDGGRIRRDGHPIGYDSDDECEDAEGIRYTRRNKGKKYAPLQKDDSLEFGSYGRRKDVPVSRSNGHTLSHASKNGSVCNNHSPSLEYEEQHLHRSDPTLSSEESSDIDAHINSYARPPNADSDTDEETDRLLQKQYQERDKHVEIPELNNPSKLESSIERDRRYSKAKEAAIRDPDRPEVLIEGVLFRARYLGSTQLISEGQPSKAMRMMQAQEAVGRIKQQNQGNANVDNKTLGVLHFGEHFQAPEGENQPSTDVDLFVSTEKIMVLNTDLQEIMMDHSLRTISYIADIGDILVIMARRRLITSPDDILGRRRRQAKILCHVFESDEAQLIAQSIGQAFQVAYLEFLKANGIEDPGLLKEMDYQDVLNQQEIYGEELNLFANKDFHKEVIVPKAKNEPLGIVIVESGWGSMVPTVVLANMMPTGPAARCGQLNIGDQIISINGVSLVGLPLSACQTYIKASRTQTVVKLTVVPCPPVVEVLIKRPDVKYQLGFSVQNGVICSLLRGGIAERGGVRVGHRIIEINNQSVVAVPHEKIVTLLASSVGEIHMKTMPTSIFRLLTGQDVPHYL